MNLYVGASDISHFSAEPGKGSIRMIRELAFRQRLAWAIPDVA